MMQRLKALFSKIKPFFDDYSKSELMFLAIVIGIGLLFRWTHLDMRPIHHDESLYGIYGYYWFNNAAQGFYKYSAMLHGPLLYYIYPFIYKIFGVTDWAVRFPLALLGSFFIFIPFFFKRYLNKNIIILLVVAICYSPLLTYYSRFSRHDPLVISELFLMLAAVTLIASRWKSVLFLFALSLHFCTKENSYIIVSMLFGYIVFELIIKKIAKIETPTLFSKTVDNIKQHRWYFLAGIALAIFIYCYFYSGEFRYAKGILDGLYRESLSYWFNQHHVQRLAGPFAFQFFILSWHELPMVLATILSVILFNIQAGRNFRIFNALIYIIAITLALLFTPLNIEHAFFFKMFKLKIPFDAFLLVFLVLHSFSITIYHLLKREDKLAFFAYLFWGTFFTYSFVGEKVPWLSLYPLITGMIYLSLYFYDSSKLLNSRSKISLAVMVLIIYGTHISFTSSFKRAGHFTEFLSQVHTTKRFHLLMQQFNEEENRSNFNIRRDYKLVLDSSIWPATWYMKRSKHYRYIAPKKGADLKAKYKYIMMDYPEIKHKFDLIKDYSKEIIPFRGWFYPRYQEMSFLDYLSYIPNHTPWKNTGHQKVVIYTRR